METWLKAKTAGIPRWAWVAGLGGAVILGLYLRSRHSSSEEGESEYQGETGGEFPSEEGGFAGGVLGGGGGSTTTPVQTPFIPEGFTEMFGQLTELIAKQSEQESSLAGIIAEMHGGGTPESPSHEAPMPEPGPSTPPSSGGSKPQCPQNIKNKIESNSSEIKRLQGEINGLQTKITNLTNQIQAHPNAKARGQWISERNQAQGSIQSKREKVSSLSAENGRLRQTAGCH